MIFKKGVSPFKNWQFEFVCYVVDAVWLKHQGHTAMMTSAMDGTHSAKSLHYQGLAWDIRTWENNKPGTARLGVKELQEIFHDLTAMLGVCFDVVVEKTHIHIEFDPDE